MGDSDRRRENTHLIDPESNALLLDVMLGKLPVFLRLCGYDAVYAGDRDVEADERLLRIGTDEERVLLTRDVQLAERADRSIRLTEREVDEQLAELRDAGVALDPADRPERCGRCNGRLDPIPKDDPTPEYAPDPASTNCWRCQDCGQVFWKGSHWDRMAETVVNTE